MGRYGAVVLGLALAVGCTTDQEPTSQTDQDASVGIVPGNYAGAKMISQPWWNGAQPPPPGTNGGYVMWMDGSQQYWNVLLVDPVKGTVNYAVKVTPNQTGQFLAASGNYGRIDIGHVPPLPGPTGGDWLARFALQYENGVQQLHKWSMYWSQ